MFEQEVLVPTRHGMMPALFAAAESDKPLPPVILYMDAPGIREELRNLARRIARAGYACILPDMYYRLGTVRFDLPRRNDGMSAVIRASMHSLTNALVTEDTGCILSWLDGQARVQSGLVGCVGYCMSGQYVTTLAAKFPHRITAAVSLYGVGIVTDQPDSPHLLLDQIRGEMYYAFAETDGSVPAHIPPTLKVALDQAGTKYELEVCPGTSHGFQFPSRADYHPMESERVWEKMFALWDRTLR